MNRPRVRFVIGGAQKCGTSALASYLAEHTGLALPAGKEAHVFDAPDFDEAWDAGAVDRRYAEHFAHAPPEALCGDATPIYLFHPRSIARIARYNPAMRWIVLLRDPVERALSHYWMERGRGTETWPLWPALLAERWRLRGHRDDFAPDSPLRRFSYRARGDYARQLDALFARFPREQVLILLAHDLAKRPGPCLERVYAFLEVDPPAQAPAARSVFSGDYPRWPAKSLRRRLLERLMRRPRRDLLARYGIGFGEPRPATMRADD